MRRSLYEADHDDFRETVRAWAEKNVVPFHDQWERDGIVPREVWTSAGAQGLLGTDMDERYGGGGVRDFRYQAVLDEELMRIGATGLGFGLHNDVAGPYLRDLGTEEQKQRWLPGCVSGDLVTAIAMTEPGAGSDLQGIRTTAVDAGDHYVLNGSKTFISNGILADLVVVVCRTDPDAGHQGISLLVVERGMEGFERGRNLDKMGLHAQDTSELFFDGARVPAANLLGEENRGFSYLIRNLPQERLVIAVRAATGMEVMLERTVAYAKERQAFGQAVIDFQHNRFKLAEAKAQAAMFRVFADHCLALHLRGELTVELAAAAKLLGAEMQNRLFDDFLQVHGGYGYMAEYEIGRAWADARVGRIYGGSSEIMKEIIGRTL